MIRRLCLPVIIFVLCFFQPGYSQSQIGISGVIDDSFEKDVRNIPFPRDKNAKIITEKELLDNLPKETSAETVYVSMFEITGNRVIDKNDILMVLSDYIERNLTLTQLNEAAQLVTKYYRKKGYIISYAYIPPQVVKDSTINIAIVEGEIGEVYVEGLSDYKKDFILKYLKPLQSGIVLDSKMLERRLMLLNSFMDLKVNATLKPGKRPGTSDIVVYAQDTNPYRASFSFDNYGNKITNEYRFNGAAMVGNVITSGDRLALNLSLGLDNFNPWQLFYGRIDYRLPLGSDGFKLGFAYSRSNYIGTKDFAKALNLEGYSNDYSIYTEYPLILRNKGTLNLGAGIYVKESADRILGVQNSQDILATASLSLFGEGYPWIGANMYYSLAFYQAFNGLFGVSNFSNTSSNPNAGGYYEKLYLDYEYHQFITWFFRMRLFLSGQFTSGTTFAGERFYIGGIYSVRGFESGIESGDNGYRLSIEAEFDLGIPQIKALLFYDRGQVFNYNADFFGYSSASLDSAGAGLRFYPWKGLAIKFDYGYPLMSSQNREAGWGVIYGRISYDF